MKRFLLLLAFVGTFSVAMADWTMNGCHFVGNKPSKSLTMNGVRIWYNGTFRHARTANGIQYWVGTDEVCVLFPKNYNGPTYEFLSTGGMVQVKYEK